MEISTNTLILALLALADDLNRTKAALATADEDDDTIGDESQRVLDMLAAISELGAVYADRRAANPDLPPASEWLPALD